MKKLLLVASAYFILLHLNTQAQVVTKYGDNVKTLNGIIKAYYDVVNIKKGQKVSYERDSLLHWPGVKVGEIDGTKNGRHTLQFYTLKQYHKISDPVIEKDGFYEYEISRKVEFYGGIYHIWSTYEARHAPGAKVFERGINSIDLFDDGTRFWILGWFFNAEQNGNLIPAKYLSY